MVSGKSTPGCWLAKALKRLSSPRPDQPLGSALQKASVAAVHDDPPPYGPVAADR